MALSMTSSMRPTEVPIMTMARAPAAWALLSPNIRMRDALEPPFPRFITQAASHLVSMAMATTVRMMPIEEVSLTMTRTSMIMPTPIRK